MKPSVSPPEVGRGCVGGEKETEGRVEWGKQVNILHDCAFNCVAESGDGCAILSFFL